MKKTFLAILALSSNLGAFAQGQVNFDTHIGTSVDARIFVFDFRTGASPLTDGFGELYIVSGTGSTAIYTPLTPIGAFGKSPQEAGYINAGVATAPAGYPGGFTVNMVMRAWVGGPGSSYETAMSRGQTAPISIMLTESPDTPNNLVGLSGFGLEIPEPAPLALGALGIGAMLLRRRRG